jgi:D-sedoheptulose 7-phosphate isomerase
MARPDLGDVPVALLAGGRATRLGAVAAQTPKSLVEVAGRPFIDHQLELLRSRGVRRVVLCLGHLGDRIEAHVRGRDYGLEVRVSHDGEKPLGTAGALRHAAPLLGETFFALYGDSYLEIEYAPLLGALPPAPTLGVMAVLRNEGRWEKSNVLFAEGRVRRYDKRAPTPEMRHVDHGVTLLRGAALAEAPREGPADLGDLYARLAEQGRLAGYEVHHRFFEIGSPQGLEETRRHLASPVSEHTRRYLQDAATVLAGLDAAAIERVVALLAAVRAGGGRVFVLGVGGGAAHASHAVNDLRKLCDVEAYAPTDNVAELTARANDDGWERVFADWLRVSRLKASDAVLVFSVGGGDEKKGVSVNIVRALEHAREVGAPVCGVVGRDGGAVARAAQACVVVPTANEQAVTAHTESFQALVWHLVVTHPALKVRDGKWESTR